MTDHFFTIDSDYARDVISVNVLAEQLLKWINYSKHINKTDLTIIIRKIKNYAANIEGKIKESGYAYFEEMTR